MPVSKEIVATLPPSDSLQSSTDQCPERQATGTRSSKAKTSLRVVGGRSARQRHRSSRSPSGKEHAPGRQIGGKGSSDMAPIGCCSLKALRVL